MTRADLIATKKALKESLEKDSKRKSIALLKKVGVLNSSGKLKKARRAAAA